MPPTLYPIRAASKLTGIGIDTLRAWERRHHAVTPTRDERGRMYTTADITRLRLLQDGVARGHAIGRLAKLSNRELGSLDRVAPRLDTEAPPILAIDTAPLLDAVERFDAHAAHIELARFAALLRPSAFLRDVVMPALAEVDAARPSHRRFRVAHARLLSAVIRNVLGTLLHLHARADGPGRLLFATMPDEPHEFGVLGAAVLAASGGLGVVYLGPDLPADEIVDSALAASADVVVLGATMAGERAAAARELTRLAARLPGDVELWLGGPAAAESGAIVGPRGLVMHGYTGLEEELARVGARL